MRYKYLFGLILVFSIVLSLNMVSASEITFNDTINENTLSQQNMIEDGDISFDSSSNQNYDVLKDNEISSDFKESREIYVNSNASDGGNGSKGNPYSTLEQACNNVSGENEVTIFLSEGTYTVGSELKFDTNNLFIKGEGNVVIKNEFDTKKPTHKQAIELTSTSANFTMDNIIFDFSGWTQKVVIQDSDKDNFFTAFYRYANFGSFNNCIFIGSPTNERTKIFGSSEFNAKFINCTFKDFIKTTTAGLFYDSSFSGDKFLYLENCKFINLNIRQISGTIFTNKNVTFNGIWFGQNELPDYMHVSSEWIIDPDTNNYDYDYQIPLKYAILNVSENYLGNNVYEIIGKLCWNGTNDTVGNAFAPMTVIFSSSTGDIVSNATLENGVFRVVYTSNSSDNKVTVNLDYETIDLNFTNLNMQVDAPSIYYGDDQNISITFSQVVNATITVTVNNKTYDVYVNTNSTTYTIKGIILPEGNYTVDVVLNVSSGKNHLYASNSTVLSVSKVSDYTFEVVPTTDIKVGDNVTIDITLPSDVNGTVIVKFGNETQTLQANATMTVTFSDLNATTYPINVTYEGNDKYTSKEKTDSVTVNKADSSVEIDDAVFTYGEVIAIPFNMTNAKGVTVIVYNKDDEEVANTSSESNIIKLDTLPAGEYTLEVTTVVDHDNYEWDSKTVKLTINKANSTLIISDKEFTYGEDAIVNVETVNSTCDVIATLIDANDKEIPVTVSGDNITLPLLNVGKYTLTVTTNVDGNHNNFTDSAVITIVKATPSMNVIVEPAENITVKDNVTLTVKLPSDATGDVVIKVNGKKLHDISANETIAINLSNNAGDYIVDVTYSGDKNYESDMTTKEFTISKAETSITANPIIFEEGNSSTIEVNISDVDSGIILVDVADKKFYGDINAGKATVLINGLVGGNYTAKISFAGDEKFNPTTDSVAVNVTAAPDIIGELNEIIKAQNSTIESQAKEISSLNDTVIAQGGTIKNQTEQISSLNDTVIAQEGTIKNQTEQISALNDTVIAQGGTIKNQTEQISSLNDTVIAQNSTIESQAKEISSLNDTVIAQNSTIENQKEQINNLTHKKDTTLVVDKTFTRAAVDTGAGEKGGMFYAILKDSNGNVLANKTVQIAINGKIYKRTTDEQGRAGIQVSFATANTYSYAISFQGDDTYNAAPMASSKLTVTKKKTTIKASNKVFKAKTKTKKISVTLKTVKNKYDKKTYLKSGKKVTLKVNGKTYKAKINKKGVAKFTIKITKKGKYTAKIKFAGDKTYKASSKTIKIRIK